MAVMTIKKTGKLFAAALSGAVLILMFAGCESYFIKDNIADDFPEDRPGLKDIN